MSQPANGSSDPIKQLRKEMGFWDVLLFNIATVLGPRWIAAAAHNGASSISLWVLAAMFFFVPSALVINELSSRFPEEGGLYVWAKEAFGDFHGFVAGWTYWIYTVFYFPGLLLASAAMSAYIIGEGGVTLEHNRQFLLWVSLGLLLVAVAITHITWANMKPAWNWDTVNFWSQIAFAFTGLELVSAMSAEVHNPQRTLPRAVMASGVLIAAMYIAGTLAVLSLVSASDVSPTSGVFHAITVGSMILKLGFLGILAALLVTVGNAGGVGSTVAGVARIPFVVGIDRYLPEAFGKIHSRWKTPYVSILVQATVSGAILLVSQINETTRGAYQFLVDAAIILYFIPFLYMFAAAIKLFGRRDRMENKNAVLIPGGKAGVWTIGILGFLVVLIGILVSLVPPGDSSDKLGFEVKLVGGTVAAIALGLMLYWRGARAKSAGQAKA